MTPMTTIISRLADKLNESKAELRKQHDGGKYRLNFWRKKKKSTWIHVSLLRRTEIEIWNSIWVEMAVNSVDTSNI